MSGQVLPETQNKCVAHRRPRYEPTDAEVDRLVDEAVKQGFPRVVTDPAVLAPIAALLRPHLIDRARSREGRAA